MGELDLRWNRWTILLYLVIALVGATVLMGAEPRSGSPDHLIASWGIEDGLPHSTVTALAQTQDGYLWLGTENGLVRFDGVRCHVFTGESSTGLPGNRVTCLYQDAAGRLWVGVEGSSTGWIAAGRFHASGVRQLESLSVTSITGTGGALWFGTVQGVVVRVQGQLVRVFGREQGLPGTPIQRLVVDDTGRVWAATDSWAGCLDDGRFLSVAETNLPALAIGARRAGGVWVVVEGQVRHYTMNGATLQMSLAGKIAPGTSARRVLEDRLGGVWIGTLGRGLMRFTGSGQADLIRHQDGLGGEFVLDLTEDNEGNLWMGSRGGGLNRLRPRLINVLDAEDGLMGEEVRSVMPASDGGVWIGTDGGGLHRFNGRQMERFPVEPGRAGGSISALCRNAEGGLWVGTWGDGLLRFVDGRWAPASPELRLAGGFIRALYEDSEGGLWVGTLRDGAYRWQGGRVTHYGPQEGLSHPDVRVILRDRGGAVWFGTGGGGLNRLADGRLTVFTRQDGLPSDFIRVLFEDAASRLWVGTAGGLACVQAGQFTAITTAQGLPDNVISQIFTDERNTFWFGSNQGIFRVRGRELEDLLAGTIGRLNCLSYTKADGLSARECVGEFQPAGCQTPDGRLWFPMLRGVAVMDPKNLRINPRPPLMAIEELVADGQVLPVGSPVYIPSGCRRLEIHYTGISLSAPQRVRFRYRLAPLETDWVEAGAQRIAAYNHLSPGRHVFEVRAANSDGVWNETSASVTLIVMTPWWRTWWFVGFSMVGGMGMIVLASRHFSLRRMKRKLAEAERQNVLARERTRIAADMHDQLGSRLTHMSLLGELARRSLRSDDPLVPHLDRIAAQSAEVARSLDEIVWTVNPRNDTLDHVAAYLVHFTEEFLEPTTIRCRLDIPADLPACPVSSEVRHHLFLAFKEALNNIVRHSGATEMSVRLTTALPWVELTVSDNGHGFDPAAASGNGLDNMRQRLHQLDGGCRITSHPGAGTEIVLRLMLNAVEMKPAWSRLAGEHEMDAVKSTVPKSTVAENPPKG